MAKLLDVPVHVHQLGIDIEPNGEVAAKRPRAQKKAAIIDQLSAEEANAMALGDDDDDQELLDELHQALIGDDGRESDQSSEGFGLLESADETPGPVPLQPDLHAQPDEVLPPPVVNLQLVEVAVAGSGRRPRQPRARTQVEMDDDTTLATVVENIRKDSLRNVLASGEWGVFLFTPKTTSKHGSVQVRCPFHAKNASTGCKKLFTVPGPSENDRFQTVRLAAWWGTQALQFDRQRSHMAWSPDVSQCPAVEVLEAHQSPDVPAGKIKTDVELDQEFAKQQQQQTQEQNRKQARDDCIPSRGSGRGRGRGSIANRTSSVGELGRPASGSGGTATPTATPGAAADAEEVESSSSSSSSSDSTSSESTSD
jgi:hypothetical protein